MNAPCLRRRVALVAAIMLLGAGCSRCSDPSHPLLWRIEGQKTSYLFGTIHFPDDRLGRLPPAVGKALEQADEVYTELKMDMASQVQMAMKSMMAGGKTLQEVLPADVYARVESLFSKKGIPMMGIARLKIWAVSVQVALADYLMEMAGGKAIDVLIYNRAEEEKKEVGGLETVDEQIGVLDSLSEQEQIHLLIDTLDERDKHEKKGEDVVKEMLELYLGGDLQGLMNKMKESYDPEDPIQAKFMKTLFEDRNRKMAERIAGKLSSSPEKSFFFAVGAGHIPADDGIVERLRRAGFKVVRSQGE